MSKHTPGPWKIAEKTTGPNIGRAIRSIPDDSGGSIAIALGEKSEECKANARLIAAAPDLLAASKLAQEQIGDVLALCYGDYHDKSITPYQVLNALGKWKLVKLNEAIAQVEDTP